MDLREDRLNYAEELGAIEMRKRSSLGNGARSVVIMPRGTRSLTQRGAALDATEPGLLSLELRVSLARS
jgi:hypothetical protein